MRGRARGGGGASAGRGGAWPRFRLRAPRCGFGRTTNSSGQQGASQARSRWRGFAAAEAGKGRNCNRWVCGPVRPGSPGVQGARTAAPVRCRTGPVPGRAGMAEGAEDLMLEQPSKDQPLLLSKGEFQGFDLDRVRRCLPPSLYL